MVCQCNIAGRSNNNPLPPIFCWCHMHLFLKNADKMFCRFIANLIGNICNREVCVLKQNLRSLQTDLLQDLCKGLPVVDLNKREVYSGV